MSEMMTPTAFLGSNADELLCPDGDLSPELIHLVRSLACRLYARLPQGCGLELGDLIQAGNIGLIKAAQVYETDRGTPLTLYAKFRIRGEMLDMVRRSMGPERSASFLRPSGSDADAESTLPTPPESSPHYSLLREERSAILREELQRLPRRDRTVVRLRYSGEMTLRQIGDVLEVKESRVCQIHRSALERLKRALRNRGFRSFAHF